MTHEAASRAIQQSQNRPGGVSRLLHHQDEVLSDSPVPNRKIIKTNDDEIMHMSEDQESRTLD